MVVVFLLLRLSPGDPAAVIAGNNATSEDIAHIREQLGLDQPFVAQYTRYLAGLFHGDMGRSYLQKTDVTTLIMARLPASLLLMAAGIAAELLIGLSMGVIAAIWRGRAMLAGRFLLYMSATLIL